MAPRGIAPRLALDHAEVDEAHGHVEAVGAVTESQECKRPDILMEVGGRLPAGPDLSFAPHGLDFSQAGHLERRNTTQLLGFGQIRASFGRSAEDRLLSVVDS